MMQIKSKNNWEVFLKKANEIYESELSKISNIYINMPEIRDYEIGKLKMVFHTNLLDYIVDKTIYNDILNKNDIKKAYDSIIDYQVINYPKYQNSIEYKNMITNLFNYRNLSNRNLLNIFRPRKSKEIMFEGLDSIGKQAMQVLVYKNIIDFFENPKYLKRMEKSAIKNDEIDNDTKNAMLQIVQNKISKSKGNNFPIQEFIGRESDTIRLKDYKGKVLLICFWASWCPDGVEACENVKLFTENIKDANIEVLSISLDNDEKEFQEVVKNNCLINGKYMRIGFGFSNRYYNILDLNSVPYLIVLDKEGKIYSSNYNTSSIKSMVRELRKLSKKGEK
ncbi:MAG: TlpA disulfide reductase family protein [bacterium]